jgi:hypothetical protein
VEPPRPIPWREVHQLHVVRKGLELFRIPGEEKTEEPGGETEHVAEEMEAACVHISTSRPTSKRLGSPWMVLPCKQAVSDALVWEPDGQEQNKEQEEAWSEEQAAPEWVPGLVSVLCSAGAQTLVLETCSWPNPLVRKPVGGSPSRFGVETPP